MKSKAVEILNAVNVNLEGGIGCAYGSSTYFHPTEESWATPTFFLLPHTDTRFDIRLLSFLTGSELPSQQDNYRNGLRSVGSDSIKLGAEIIAEQTGFYSSD
ncbi:hypothetical protein CMEL01_10852 [Colletotrichum melonis]|uniref:Uncharacterized protein n=1 Tax=Colletotrichum melonis TaxID=1209925 RepID=A0AAI9UXX5_9PEZI|nr:hypothetical protein CMEL01_10852 [Colletotrichum melonis]